MARIVVADDHEVVRSGIQAMIAAHASWEVCGSAENGEEAVELVVELKPDLIILDLSMPVMNGLQAAIKIRRLAPSTKILILSMHDASLVKQVASLCGADAYVGKNAPRATMINTVAALLEGRAPAHSPH